MGLYSYRARDRAGELTSGELEGEDEAQIVASLDKLGYSVIEIKTNQSSSLSLSTFFERFKRIEKQEVIIFSRQLATLLRTGMPLSPSLTTLCEQTANKKLKAILEDVQQSVSGGASFSQALSKYLQVFPELFISMVEVGEAAGILDKTLDRLATLGMQELETNSRIRSALVYPVILVLISFVVVNFLVVGVLPKFVMVFRASQAKLPFITQVVLSLSWILRKLWFFIIAGFAALAFWFKNYIRKPEGKFKFHTWILKLPIFGSLYTKVQVSRFSRMLSALTSSGVPLLQALMVVEKTLTNVVIRRSIQNIRTAITEGRSLVEPFKASGFFSPMVVQMISTGEKTGKLDQMLEEVSAFYDPEIEYTVKNLTSLLEPFMLLAMGVMVAFIALSVLLPIFNLIKVFRG